MRFSLAALVLSGLVALVSATPSQNGQAVARAADNLDKRDVSPNPVNRLARSRRNRRRGLGKRSVAVITRTLSDGVVTVTRCRVRSKTTAVEMTSSSTLASLTVTIDPSEPTSTSTSSKRASSTKTSSVRPTTTAPAARPPASSSSSRKTTSSVRSTTSSARRSTTSSARPTTTSSTRSSTKSSTKSSTTVEETSTSTGVPSASDMLKIANEYRARAGLKDFTWSTTLRDNAYETSRRTGGTKLEHVLLSGTMGQVMVFGSTNYPACGFDTAGTTTFGLAFYSWVCEVPSSTGLGQSFCNKIYDASSINAAGQTGHYEILSSSKYTKIGCGFYRDPSAKECDRFPGVWTCDVA